VKFVQSQNGQLISRISLFNLNFEYFVFNPWIEKLSKLFSSGDVEIKSKPSPSHTLPPSQFSLSLSDCSIGLNPLDLSSRGIILITSTAIRGQWDFQNGGRGKFDVNLNKAHLFCIDDVSNLITPRQTRFRVNGRKEILGYFNVCNVFAQPDT